MPKKLTPLLVLLLLACAQHGDAQTIARLWNEQLLEAIRNDFARPTVHARNLYHTSVAAYDCWAVYDSVASPIFLGNTLGTVTLSIDGLPAPSNVDSARHAAISYASYRLLRYRFRNSPGRAQTWFSLDSIMFELGYDTRYNDTNYRNGDPRALGNYLGDGLVRYGMTDGSNDAADYANLFYQAINPPLVMDEEGNPTMLNADRWQPLSLSTFIDQSGNPIPGGNQEFLGPEWGAVIPFALDPVDADTFQRDGNDYVVYHDPGPPPYLLDADPALRERYQRGFEMVAIWSSLLDPDDDLVWDVGPGARGINVDPLPDFEDYYGYYDEFGGGDTTTGLRQNPYTGQPYAPSSATRGDYGRVLAEFWADGPDSETPPGHWFTIINYVFDQPDFTTRWRGLGPVLDTLEYQVKAYLALGGAMHDAAISTWGIKGWYDYVRPVSAIRFMAERGQRSDPAGTNYHPFGLRIEPGLIEQITDMSDPLAGPNGENIGEMKLYAWLGPEEILDPETDAAGIGWMLAKKWWPYQRPTFVSPPFAGYVSGHSTYSRAAAEILTSITGTPYFPGGLGEFIAPKNEFLVFEEGPKDTVRLQWATYRDASDEVSLSRIFGGIHPPADDIPGRRIGIEVAADALVKANQLYDAITPTPISWTAPDLTDVDRSTTFAATMRLSEPIDTNQAVAVEVLANGLSFQVGNLIALSDSSFTVNVQVGAEEVNADSAYVRLVSAVDVYGNAAAADTVGVVRYDTRRPAFTATASRTIVQAADTSVALVLTLEFDEAMDQQQALVWSFATSGAEDVFSVAAESWTDEDTYELILDIDFQADVTLSDVAISVQAADLAGNPLRDDASQPLFDVDFTTSGVEVLPSGAVVRLFPVPLADQLSIITTKALAGELRIVSTSGQVLRQFQLAGFGGSRTNATGALSYRYDIQDLLPGTYLVELRTEAGERATWTVVK